MTKTRGHSYCTAGNPLEGAVHAPRPVPDAVRYGTEFKKPNRSRMRRHRAKSAAKMFKTDLPADGPRGNWGGQDATTQRGTVNYDLSHVS